MKSRRFVVCVLASGFILCLGLVVWARHDPLKRYGITYEIEYGEHAESQLLWFYWNRNQRQTMGPRIAGDDLYVRYKYVGSGGVPEIVVRSERGGYTVLKVNFTDPTKPGIEVIENHGLGVVYPPPWDTYYK